jgi:hypothetical protein
MVVLFFAKVKGNRVLLKGFIEWDKKFGNCVQAFK